MKKKGFSLGELLVVMITIAVLSALAVTQYRNAIWSSRVTKAKNSIAIIAQAEKILEVDAGGYVDVGWVDSFEAKVGTAQSGLSLDAIDNDTDWAYEVDGPNAKVFAKFSGAGAPAACIGQLMEYDLAKSTFKMVPGCW